MNGPLILAQASTSGQGAGTSPPKVIKLAKPQAGQALTLAINGATKIDFSDIANEKITLVHVGDRLVILFEGGATVSVGPFFDSTGKPFSDITLELAPDRVVSSSEFAALFPITDDQTVLPAAGNQPPSSSFYFDQPVTIDPLTSGSPTIFSSGPPVSFTIASIIGVPQNSSAANSDAGGGDSNVPASSSARTLSRRRIPVR